jgi:YebC/PmpR family DNA-binding regulatory protein
MGAQWKQAGREANAQKKGQMVVKLVREITVAAKLGGADPELNARLAAAVEKAKRASVYRDTIERAIKKGAGLTDEVVNYETVVYEGFAPHKVPVVVECLTDNRNRTAPEIRNLFKAGSLGQPGSVAFFFNHLGVVEATHTDNSRDTEGDAIEAGAQEVEPLDASEVPEGQKGARFLTEMARLPVSVRSIQYLIKELAEQANVANRFNLSPHSMRHYFADGLLTFTGNLALVQEALGHQDPKTTRIYTKIKVEEIAKSVQGMSQKAAKDETEE